MIIRSKDKVNVKGKNKPVMGSRHRCTDRYPQHRRCRAERDNTQLRSHQVSPAIFGGVPSCNAEKARQRRHNTRLSERS